MLRTLDFGLLNQTRLTGLLTALLTELLMALLMALLKQLLTRLLTALLTEVDILAQILPIFIFVICILLH